MRAPATIRLFTALWPTADVRESIARWQGRWQWPADASVVDPDRLHLTLHFLGAVAPDRVADLKYVLERVAAHGFVMQFGKPDLWQRGTAVLRPANSPTALRGLHARIGLAIAQVGLALDEREFRPHVTLARRAQGAVQPAEQADFSWESKGGFALVQTLGGGRGYEVLEKFGA